MQKQLSAKKGGSTSRCWNAKTKSVLESGYKKVSKTNQLTYSFHILAILSWPTVLCLYYCVCVHRGRGGIRIQGQYFFVCFLVIIWVLMGYFWGILGVFWNIFVYFVFVLGIFYFLGDLFWYFLIQADTGYIL